MIEKPEETPEVNRMSKRGKWKPMDDKHKNDRIMITHTGYIVDTETDCIFLSVQGFIDWVNGVLEERMTEKRYFLHKRLGRDVIHDTLCHNWLKGEELEEHMNVQYTKYSALKKENEQLKKELEDALLDVKIYKNANATFDNVYQENEKLKSRIEYLERKIERERNATNKQYEKWEKEALEKINKLENENEQLKYELDCFKSCNDKLQKELIKKVEEKAKLKTQNQGIQDKVMRLLDYVEIKQCVTRTEIKKWWNGDVE